MWICGATTIMESLSKASWLLFRVFSASTFVCTDKKPNEPRPYAKKARQAAAAAVWPTWRHPVWSVCVCGDRIRPGSNWPRRRSTIYGGGGFWLFRRVASPRGEIDCLNWRSCFFAVWPFFVVFESRSCLIFHEWVGCLISRAAALRGLWMDVIADRSAEGQSEDRRPVCTQLMVSIVLLSGKKRRFRLIRCKWKLMDGMSNHILD